jgi:hypothetical protein
MVRDFQAHTTIFSIKNTAPSRNDVRIQVFDNHTEETLIDITARMPADSVYTYDTMFDESVFGELPTNAGDGFVGSIRFTANHPIAVMAYGDEMEGDGSSAYVGRPSELASTVQYLPIVRENFVGNSLIAVANPSSSAPVAVSISYYGHSSSAVGVGESFEQRMNIEPLGTAIIDLAMRGRTTVPTPAIPFGRSKNEGFLGSAVITASGPVLAVVQEELATRGRVRSIAAYNGFGPSDLGTRFVVARHQTGSSRWTRTVLMNPSDRTASVSVVARAENGEVTRAEDVQLAPRDTHFIDSSPRDASLEQLEISSDVPLAALEHETNVLGPDDWGKWGLDAMLHSLEHMGSNVQPVFTSTPAPTYTPSPPPPSPTATAEHRWPTLTPTLVPGMPPTAMPTEPGPGSAQITRLYLPWLARSFERHISN